MAAKTSPPLGGRSGVAGTKAPEELGTGAAEELETICRVMRLKFQKIENPSI